MRTTLLLSLLWPTAGLADPGHLGSLAGHDHWLAGAAIGLAVLVGVLGALRGGPASPGSHGPGPADRNAGDGPADDGADA